MLDLLQDQKAIESAVNSAVQAQGVLDMHTHLYPPSFGTPVPNRSGKTDNTGMALWGIDELLTYHYLIAEVFRVVPATQLPYEHFWKMSKIEQADHIFKHLFVERAPISEACRGVLTAIGKLGLDPNDRKLDGWRKWFKEQDPSQYVDKVMEVANVKLITMTNPVFDDNERNRWLDNPKVASDPRFRAVLRIDPVLQNWPMAARAIGQWGYDAGDGKTLSAKNIEEGRRFLREWVEKQQAVYMALSLGPEFRYPAESGLPTDAIGQTALEKIILPVCAEKGLAFAMMIGSIRGVNPALRDAGDMSGKSDVQAVVRLCAAFPNNRFFVTMLARENQHEMCVAARKFGNLMLFGCWWFLNNPSLIEEIERMRMELLGTSFIPQHSDARVLDHLVYKWDHSRKVIAKVMTDKFTDLLATGRAPSAAEIKQTAELFLAGNYRAFAGSL